MIPRRALLAGTAAVMAASATARGDEPPVSLLVGGPAGSVVDQGARAFLPFLERHLPGVRIAVVNRPGDVGVVALRLVAAAEADGRTLGWVSTPSLPARSIDRLDAGRLLESLKLVGAVSKEPIAVVSPAGGPVASVRDLIARSSEDASSIPLGTPPSGSAPHLAALRLQALSGTRLNIVDFPSAAAARQAAVAGNVAAALLALGDVVDVLRTGKLTGLGIAARRRLDGFPDLAPLQDSGLALSAVIQRGIALPAGASRQVVAQLAAALEAVVADPEFAGQGEQSGFKPSWVDGQTWATQAAADRAALAQLWTAAPWLAVGFG